MARIRSFRLKSGVKAPKSLRWRLGDTVFRRTQEYELVRFGGTGDLTGPGSVIMAEKVTRWLREGSPQYTICSEPHQWWSN